MCAHELLTEGIKESLEYAERAKKNNADIVKAANDAKATKEVLDTVAQSARALGALARLIDPKVGKDVEAVMTFAAEAAVAVGIYYAAGTAWVVNPVVGLVATLAVAVVHLISNLTAGEDPSITLLREFRAAIREVFERLDQLDAKVDKLRQDVLVSLTKIEGLILKEGEERRREAAAILTALGEHNADLKQAFFNLAELIRGIDQRKTTIAVNKVVKPAVPLAQPQFAQAVNDAVAEIETPAAAAAAFPDLVGLADTPTGLLWRDLGGVAAAINAATGKPLVPAVGADGQLLDFLGRLAEYDRLLTESPAARSLINRVAAQ